MQKNFISTSEGILEKAIVCLWRQIAESSRNPRLCKALFEHRIKIFQLVSKYLSQQVEKGYFRSNIDVEAISAGLVALYDGLTINMLLGINETHNRKIWTETIRALCAGIG